MLIRQDINLLSWVKKIIAVTADGCQLKPYVALSRDTIPLLAGSGHPHCSWYVYGAAGRKLSVTKRHCRPGKAGKGRISYH